MLKTLTGIITGVIEILTYKQKTRCQCVHLQSIEQIMYIDIDTSTGKSLALSASSSFHIDFGYQVRGGGKCSSCYRINYCFRVSSALSPIDKTRLETGLQIFNSITLARCFALRARVRIYRQLP